MRVLVACEESQTVCKAFRNKGHEAYSCDILPCSGGHSGWHIQDDVLKHLNKGWDLMVAHPPCTYLTNSGVCWLKDNPERKEKMKAGALFFKKLLNTRIPKVCIENPIMHKYAVEIIGRRQDQVIQPFMFGNTERKATCLWLKNLPLLKETNNVKEEMLRLPKKEQQRIHYISPGKDRSKIRSKTFKGIAKAMAEQWGPYNSLYNKEMKDNRKIIKEMVGGRCSNCGEWGELNKEGYCVYGCKS